MGFVFAMTVAFVSSSKWSLNKDYGNTEKITETRPQGTLNSKRLLSNIFKENNESLETSDFLLMPFHMRKRYILFLYSCLTIVFRSTDYPYIMHYYTNTSQVAKRWEIYFHVDSWKYCQCKSFSTRYSFLPSCQLFPRVSPNYESFLYIQTANHLQNWYPCSSCILH